MPTENRSSNTEQMISVPRGLIELAVTHLPNDSVAWLELHEVLNQPAAQHQADGFSAGDMADQGAKAFAARDGEVEELYRALGGMLFAFDDGVGRDWSQDLLDYARKLAPAVEFKSAK